jgi:hypothetical protein
MVALLELRADNQNLLLSAHLESIAGPYIVIDAGNSEPAGLRAAVTTGHRAMISLSDRRR